MKRTFCFVVQHSRAQETDVNVPSGTLTVLRELIDNWDRQDKILILCNQDYGNLTQLEELCGKYDLALYKNRYLTKQDGLDRRQFHRGGKKLPVFERAIFGLAGPFVTLRVILQLRRFLKSNSVDVIYSHNGGYPGGDLNRLITIAGALAGVKNNFLIVHNLPNAIRRRRLPLRLLEYLNDRIIGKAASKIVSVSEAAARALEQDRNFGKQISWIYNGIPAVAPDLATTAVPSWAERDTGAVIMFLGTLTPRKGLDVLLKSASELRASWTLVIYGTGGEKYKNNLVALASNLGIRENVVFAGFHPQASRFIDYCDMLVLPSLRYESFGMVLLEAMRLKKPVICTDVGGMKEVVDDGKTGLIVPSGDVTRLREAIEDLLGDPQRARNMGLAGYERLLKYFDIRKTVKKYAELID